MEKDASNEYFKNINQQHGRYFEEINQKSNYLPLADPLKNDNYVNNQTIYQTNYPKRIDQENNETNGSKSLDDVSNLCKKQGNFYLFFGMNVPYFTILFNFKKFQSKTALKPAVFIRQLPLILFSSYVLSKIEWSIFCRGSVKEDNHIDNISEERNQQTRIYKQMIPNRSLNQSKFGQQQEPQLVNSPYLQQNYEFKENNEHADYDDVNKVDFDKKSVNELRW